MAAKKNDPRREARIAKNNRNLNSALTLFTAGFIAEFYLLLINQYFVKGSVDQVVAIAGYLEVMAIVGAAAFGAGVVLTVMRRKWTRFAAAGKWLLGLGLFFGVSSLLMRRVYPMGTTVMCILVPVLMLLAVVFLLYQHEFAVQAIALTLAIASAVLLNHGSSSMPALVTAFCWAAMVLVAALLVLTVILQGDCHFPRQDQLRAHLRGAGAEHRRHRGVAVRGPRVLCDLERGGAAVRAGRVVHGKDAIKTERR